MHHHSIGRLSKLWHHREGQNPLQHANVSCASKRIRGCMRCGRRRAACDFRACTCFQGPYIGSRDTTPCCKDSDDQQSVTPCWLNTHAGHILLCSWCCTRGFRSASSLPPAAESRYRCTMLADRCWLLDTSCGVSSSVDGLAWRFQNHGHEAVLQCADRRLPGSCSAVVRV